MASQTETQGLVLTEAMAAGTPCVTVGAMGTRDVMSEGGGIMVPPKEDQFAEAVNKLLQNRKLLREKQKEALKIAGKNSALRRAKQLMSVYQKMLM